MDRSCVYGQYWQTGRNVEIKSSAIFWLLISPQKVYLNILILIFVTVSSSSSSQTFTNRLNMSRSGFSLRHCHGYLLELFCWPSFTFWLGEILRQKEKLLRRSFSGAFKRFLRYIKYKHSHLELQKRPPCKVVLNVSLLKIYRKYLQKNHPSRNIKGIYWSVKQLLYLYLYLQSPRKSWLAFANSATSVGPRLQLDWQLLAGPKVLKLVPIFIFAFCFFSFYKQGKYSKGAEAGLNFRFTTNIYKIIPISFFLSLPW